MIFKVFYSWQSDLPNNINRSFIEQALEKAAKSIRSEAVLEVEPVIDRDTQGVPGAPDISNTIFTKIARSQVFVCDVSIVNEKGSTRPSPNPNVLLELGYALRILGESRIILIMNTAFGGPELLPFDLRKKKVITYCQDTPGQGKADERKMLAARLKQEISTIINMLDLNAKSTSRDAVQIVLKEISESPRSAVIKLGDELEHELRKIIWSNGWFTELHALTITDAIEVLEKKSCLTKDDILRIRALLTVRNRLLRGEEIKDDRLFFANSPWHSYSGDGPHHPS